MGEEEKKREREREREMDGCKTRANNEFMEALVIKFIPIRTPKQMGSIRRGVEFLGEWKK